MQGQPPPPQKKSNVGIIIGVIVVVFIFLGLIGAIMYFEMERQKEEDYNNMYSDQDMAELIAMSDEFN